MQVPLTQAGPWLRRRSEDFAALLLVSMFLCFLIQIFFRYVLNNPVGWTEEVCVTAWLWCVLWGAVFVLDEKNEIRFDIIYTVVSDNTRRVFTIITSLALVTLYSISLPGVISYVMFMKVERSAYLGIRMDFIFSIYVVFAAGAIVRYAWLGWRAVRGEAPEVAIAGGSAL